MFLRTDETPLNVTNPDRIRRIRDVFDCAGYTWPRLFELFRDAKIVSSQLSWRHLPRLLQCCTGGSPLEVLTRLFLLGRPMTEPAVRRAVAPMDTADWIDAGLLAVVDDQLIAAMLVKPLEGHLFVQEAATPWLPADRQVMPISGSTIFLLRSMVRRSSAVTLDVGTGCGVLGLLAASRAGRVVCTDCNPRALNMSIFNAHFNRITNIEVRAGDLFEPVAGEHFDLIVSNPPYVISPENRALYRDSGLPGDSMSERIIRTAPRFLRPDGFAQVLINWLQVTGQDWRDRLRGWLEGSGCDAWLLNEEVKTPAHYATEWLPGANDEAAFERKYADWLAYYDRAGVEAIGGGQMILRRRASGVGWFAHDELPRLVDHCDEAILQGFAQRDFLVANHTDAALLAARLARNPTLSCESKLRSRDADWETVSHRVHLSQGLCFKMDLDQTEMAILTRIRGDRPLHQVLSELAESLGVERTQFYAAALPFVRSLMEHHFVVPATAGSGPAISASSP